MTLRPLIFAMLIGSIFALSLSAMARAGGRAGKFDYYVLALSWSPGWCTLKGDARNAPECRAGAGRGFVLHGLWPEYSAGGWPEHCPTSLPPPARRLAEGMADIMPSAALARYQWAKHGVCSGLPAPEYFAAARQAFEGIKLPDALKPGQLPARMTVRGLKSAFLRANAGLTSRAIAVVCTRGILRELRICLTRDLKPRACGTGVRDYCSDSVTIPPRR